LLYINKNVMHIISLVKKVTIITPSCRIDNLKKIEQSINFEYIDEWIIVYDGNKIESRPSIYI